MEAGLDLDVTCDKCGGEFVITVNSEEDIEGVDCPFCTGYTVSYAIDLSGTKHDDDKTPLSLLPFDALEEVGRVFQFGAKKYSPHNWRKGFQWSRLASACLRHTTAWIMGEDRDPETGYLHTAHAVCCLLMLISHQLYGYGTDDRFKLEDKTKGE